MIKIFILVIILVCVFNFILFNKETFYQNYGGSEPLPEVTAIKENQILNILKNDPDIYRKYLKNLNDSDQEILDLYQEYSDLRDYIKEKKFDNLNKNLNQLRNNYNNTKKKLERILYNKYNPNKINFYDENQEFKDRMKTFISSLKDIKEGVPQKYYENKLTLYPNDKKSLKIELNKIQEQIYLFNLNGSCLKYNDDKNYIYSTCSNTDNSFWFRVAKIYDKYHFNQFIKNNKITGSQSFNYPLYLIIPYNDYDNAVTIKDNQLSIQSLDDESVRENQIFYE